MNKKLLSIACMALVLCVVSKPSAAADMKIFGRSLKDAFKDGVTKMVVSADPNEVTILHIQDTGISRKRGALSKVKDLGECLIRQLNKAPSCLTAQNFEFERDLIRTTRPVVGKNKISISGEHFMLPRLTILGTNGEMILNLTNPHSLIKSITLFPSNITAPFNGEELHIGSVWGEFTGAPSSDLQIIHFVGYSSAVVEFNPEAIAELLSKK